MAASVTLTNLISRVRFEADFQNSLRATDADITQLVNTHYAELFDRLVASGPPDYYKSSTTLTTVAGTLGYALPADFRSILAVLKNDTAGNRLFPIQPMREGQRGAYVPPQGVYPVVVEYIPTPAVLVAGTDVVDGVSGWDELVVQLCARALMRRDRRDTAQFDTTIGEARARVMSNAPKRDSSGPRYVQDVEESDNGLYAGFQGVNAWTLNGTTLNVYQTSPSWP